MSRQLIKGLAQLHALSSRIRALVLLCAAAEVTTVHGEISATHNTSGDNLESMKRAMPAFRVGGS